MGSILATAVKAGRRETGGILIGRYDADGWMAEVVEATTKPRGSRAGWWWFRRGNAGLRELLSARWCDGYHYLGEWHFHPGGSSQPSGTDLHSMREISADPAYQCPEPILAIIGGRPTHRWELSVSVTRATTHLPLTRRV
jgi:proteasome lid subunit RPN8/RPN11